MNILKLITFFLLTVLPIAVLFRDWKFHDRRTKKHHNITRNIIVVWCIAGLFAGYFVRSEIRKNKELVDKIDQLSLQNEKLRETIMGYKEETLDLMNKQIQVYKETLEEVNKGKIPAPPNFIALQEKTLLSSVHSIEEWARKLGTLKGVEKDRLNLEYAALDTKATQLNLQWRPFFEPVITTFKELISALNNERAFGSKITFEVLENNIKAAIPSNAYKRGSDGKPFMTINIPSGQAILVYPQPLDIKPETILNPEFYPSIRIIGEHIDLRIGLQRDGTYKLLPVEPRSAFYIIEEWIGELGENGGRDFLSRVIQRIFQKEILFN